MKGLMDVTGLITYKLADNVEVRADIFTEVLPSRVRIVRNDLTEGILAGESELVGVTDALNDIQRLLALKRTLQNSPPGMTVEQVIEYFRRTGVVEVSFR